MIFNAEHNGVHATFELEPFAGCIVNEVWRDNVYQVTPTAGMRVLDIGAHKGVFAVYCAAHGASVVAYEPNPETYQALLHNISTPRTRKDGDVRCGSVMAHNLGIWTERGVQTLHTNAVNTGGSSMFGTGADTVEIATVTLADAMQDKEWDIVKLDAEGIEFAVIAQASDELLSKIKYLTIEVHNDMATQAQYDAMLAKIERLFHYTGVREASGRLNYLYCTRRYN